MTSSDSDIDDLPQDDTLAEESLAETASDADSTDEDSTDEQDQKLTLDVTIDEPSACERHITVTVARPDIERYLDDAFGELVPKAEVPGFRIGRAPRKLVETRFKREIGDQVKGSILMDAMTQISADYDFSAISEPDFDFDSIAMPDDGDLTDSAQDTIFVELNYMKYCPPVDTILTNTFKITKTKTITMLGQGLEFGLRNTIWLGSAGNEDPLGIVKDKLEIRWSEPYWEEYGSDWRTMSILELRSLRKSEPELSRLFGIFEPTKKVSLKELGEDDGFNNDPYIPSPSYGLHRLRKSNE